MDINSLMNPQEPADNLPPQLARIDTLALGQPVSAPIHLDSDKPSPSLKRERAASPTLAPEEESTAAKLSKWSIEEDDLVIEPQSLCSVASVSAANQSGAPGSNGSPPFHIKGEEESPAKKQSKWTPKEDDLLVELRGQGMKWDDIAKRLPGRSSISCRLRYQNYLEKRAVWDEEKKNKLARLYARFKDQMWQKVATDMGIPWRTAESMHWQLGEQEMNKRANTPTWQMHRSATSRSQPDVVVLGSQAPDCADTSTTYVNEQESRKPDVHRNAETETERFYSIGSTVPALSQTLPSPAEDENFIETHVVRWNLGLAFECPRFSPLKENPTWFCTFCRELGILKSFSSFIEQEEHEKSEHEVGIRWHCDIKGCNEAFDLKKKYDAHIKTHRVKRHSPKAIQSNRYYSCGFQYCEMLTDAYAKHRAHYLTHMVRSQTAWSFSSTIHALLDHPSLKESWKLVCSKFREEYGIIRMQLQWDPATTWHLRQRLQCFDFGESSKTFFSLLVQLYVAGSQVLVEE